MPDNKTHRRVGPAAASLVLWGLAVPWFVWPVVLWLAELSSPWPDKMEGPFRRARRRLLLFVGDPPRLRRRPLMMLEPPLRYLQRHRWWTHGIPAEMLVAAAIGGVVIGLGLALGTVGVEIAAANSRASAGLPTNVEAGVAWVGIFVALGLGVGMAAHSLLDAGTDHGSPIGWPFFSKRVHVLPKSLWIGERGERWLRALSAPFVVVMAYLSFAPSWWLPYAWHHVETLLR